MRSNHEHDQVSATTSYQGPIRRQCGVGIVQCEVEKIWGKLLEAGRRQPVTNRMAVGQGDLLVVDDPVVRLIGNHAIVVTGRPTGVAGSATMGIAGPGRRRGVRQAHRRP